MATSKRSAGAIHAPAQHAEHVHLVAQGDAPAPGMEEVSTSWQRSANKYGVDPVDSTAPRIVTAQELKDLREPIEKLIFNAQEELDRLYKVVRKAGYAVLFCDTTGVAVEHRGEDTEAEQFKYWGTWLGGVWSEAIEGTNGIGTCIVEERPCHGPQKPAFSIATHRPELLRRTGFRCRRKTAGDPGCVCDQSRTLRAGACADWRPYRNGGARHRRTVFPRTFPPRMDHRARTTGGRRPGRAAGCRR